MEKTIQKIKLSPKTYIEPISMYPKIMYKIKAKGFTPYYERWGLHNKNKKLLCKL